MYYFQGDLGESLEYPNAFVIPNNSKPTFGAFLANFPAHEKGTLHFRFRMEDPNCGYVWLDITAKDEVLPIYQDSIMAKVLRADQAPTLKRRSMLRRKNMETFGSSIVNGGAAVFSRPAHEVQPPAAVPKKAERPTSSGSAGTNSPAKFQPTTSSAATSAKQAPAPASVPKPKSSTAVASSATSPPDILDFEASGGNSAKSAGGAPTASAATPVSPPADILDFGDSVDTSSDSARLNASAKVSSSNLEAMMDLDGAPTLSRAELKASRESKINDQVQKAVAEKLEQDRKAEQEQTDFDSARAVHDQKLLAWSTNNKERRNIRSLLSTMHTVLWPDSRWKEIGLGDLLEPRQVKLQYRKAMLVVHPDHNVKLSNENKYISKRIFEAVNEAYNEFTTKETV